MTGDIAEFRGNDQFSINQLRYFCAAAKLGSLARAATERHVSATAIAAAVDALEASFGAQLCIRRKARGIELTPTGRILFEEALALIRDADQLGKRIRATDDELTGTLRVGCFSNLATLIVPGVLAAFEQTHPNASLEFTVEMNSQLIDAVQRSEIDCIIGYDKAIPTGFGKKRLAKMKTFVAVNPQHRFAHRTSLTLEDLKDEPMVLFQSAVTPSHSPPMFGPHPLPFDVRFRSSQIELVRSLVRSGWGFTLTLEPADAPMNRASGNVLIPLETNWPDEHIVLAWNKAVRPYPQLTAFIQLTERLAAEKKLLVPT